MAKHKHIRSSFEDFLEEEGILQECKEETARHVLVGQLEQEMPKKPKTQVSNDNFRKR